MHFNTILMLTHLKANIDEIVMTFLTDLKNFFQSINDRTFESGRSSSEEIIHVCTNDTMQHIPKVPVKYSFIINTFMDT